jgi:streptogramin lyase
MSDLRIAATIPIGKTADWVAITADGVWIGSTGPYAVNEIDPATNHVTTVELPGHPCAGIAADSENLWVPLCGDAPKLAKVDLKTRTLSAVFNTGPAGPEGGVAVGAGSVWMVVDKQGSLARIDPLSGAVVDVVHLPPGSYNPVFSDGRIWVSRADGAELTIVDAGAAKVLGSVPVGLHPRFLTAGAGAVWTLNQGDGSLSRIDEAGSRPVAALQLHTPGPGGDITYADGRVWSTMMKTPLTAVDAAKSVVLCQWKGAGGDAIGVGHGAIWLTNLTAGTVSRIELSDIPDDCRAEGLDGAAAALPASVSPAEAANPRREHAAAAGGRSW